MVGMPRISCFLSGAEPCIIMLIKPTSMLMLLIMMLILLISMLDLLSMMLYYAYYEAYY